jgi:sugar O-acyltransferase (sialic acid O-acetyltransferase NeuD family)
MIVVGAGGFAKELYEVIYKISGANELCFFDNITEKLASTLFDKKILRTLDEAKTYLYKFDNRYVLGIGNPILRKKMCENFDKIGGDLISIVSPNSNIGRFGVSIGNGATILANANITSNVKIGKGLLMYPNAIITHDCILGDFVELSPGATILGQCVIGDFSQIGANATILPGIKIGKNVVIGAGAVVTKDVPDNSLSFGVPAKVLNHKVNG